LFLRGQQLAAATGLEGLTGVIDVAPGDFDNDGLDGSLCADGRWSAVVPQHGRQVRPATAKLPARRSTGRSGSITTTITISTLSCWTRARADAESGSGWMEDRTGDFPFVKGR